jgi:hypothetical protein
LARIRQTFAKDLMLNHRGFRSRRQKIILFPSCLPLHSKQLKCHFVTINSIFKILGEKHRKRATHSLLSLELAPPPSPSQMELSSYIILGSRESEREKPFLRQEQNGGHLLLLFSYIYKQYTTIFAKEKSEALNAAESAPLCFAMQIPVR